MSRTLIEGRRRTFRHWSWRVTWELVPRDLWVGVYWRSMFSMGYEIRNPERAKVRRGGRYPAERTHFDAWLCPLPCLPIHLSAHVQDEPARDVLDSSP